MLPEFVLLPPEVNSARMYAGPRSQTMWAAAAAWDGLAAQLSSAASAFGSTVSGLTGATWLGPASLSMAAAAAPFVEWLSATSVQAERVANQARLSAGAFEAAFAATVPPTMVAANRAQLTALIATNILGQNTAAIAATEAEYAEMWAQDATAMTGYDASTAAAEAQWTPFSAPPARLAAPAQAVDSTGPQLLSSLKTSMSRLEMLSTPAELAMEPMNMLMGQLMTSTNSLSGGGAAPAMSASLASAVNPVTAGVSAAPLNARAVLAGVGRAGSIGPLSVPASWPGAASATAPAATVAAAPGAGHAAAGAPRLPYLPTVGAPGLLRRGARCRS